MKDQLAYIPQESKQIEPTETKTYYDNVSMESIFGAGIQGELGAFLNAVIAYYLFAVCDSVHTAITIVSDEFSQIRPVLQDKNTKEYITEHPALELLESNDFRFNETQVKKEMMISYMASGECFPVIGGNVNYEPVSLFHYPACNVSVVQSGDGYINNILASYQNVITNFTRAQTSPIYKNLHTFVFEDQPKLGQMMHILSNRRRNYLRAQSDLESIYYQATMKFYTQMHNSGIVRNGSRGSAIWGPKVPLSEEQFVSFKTSIKEGFTGPANAGKNIIPPFPIDYVNLLLTNRDMDFEKLMGQADTDVYNNFRIPLPLVTKDTMTLSNYANAIYALFDLAVLPKSKFLFANVGQFLLARFKDGSQYRMCIDDREIPALKQRLLERGQAMRNIYGFSEDEIRNEVGYEPRTDGKGKTVYIPATYVDSAQPVMDYQSGDPGKPNGNIDDNLKKKEFKSDDEGQWVTLDDGRHILIAGGHYNDYSSKDSYNKYVEKYHSNIQDKYSGTKTLEYNAYYRGVGYGPINQALRGELPNKKDETFYKNIGEDINKYTEENPLKENIKLFRGMTVSDSALENIKGGNAFEPKNILSMSSNPKNAETYANSKYSENKNSIIMEISAKKGSSITPLISLREGKIETGENEFIGSYKNSYKILSVIKIGKGKYKVNAEI